MRSKVAPWSNCDELSCWWPRLAALANRILRNLDLIEAKATLNLTIGFGLVGPMSRRGEPERSPQRRAAQPRRLLHRSGIRTVQVMR